MEYAQLGNSGLMVSRLTLGTVELGMNYGFRHSQHYAKPEPSEAIRIIHRALDLGINLIDTAPNYGNSEELIGRALKQTRQRAFIASKVTIPELHPVTSGNLKTLRGEILHSIEMSLSALRIETVDLLQIHNTSIDLLNNGEVLATLRDAQQQGKVRCLGASCHGEAVPLAALEAGCFDALQVPFNILDRRILPAVLSRAKKNGVGILTRSAFLRGVLTSGIYAVPEQLAEVKEVALQVWAQLNDGACSLSELALRFCLSFDQVSSVIIGVRSTQELESNVDGASKGSLSPIHLKTICGHSLTTPALLDPYNWQGLI